MAYVFKVLPEKQMKAYADLLSATDRGGRQEMVWIKVFDNYCGTHWRDAEMLTQEMVDEWCAKRPTEKNNSTRTRIYPIIQLLRYLRERGLTEVGDPAVPRAERSTYIPHAFSGSELSAFFSACDSYPISQRSARSWNLKMTIPVFFRLLYSSGIRTTEARLLRRADVDLGRGILDIRKSKGSCQHFVVLHDSMLGLMRIYDSTIDELYPNRAYFFPVDAKKGRASVWVWQTFNKVWATVSDVSAVPYELRHNYAIENINRWSGLGFGFHDRLLYLSKSMGHASIESTKSYYSLVPPMAELLQERTEAGFNDIIAEVDYEESVD
jgi:integrase